MAAEGGAKTGFQLPSAIGGAALVEDIPGCVWREIVDSETNAGAEAEMPVALNMQAGSA